MGGKSYEYRIKIEETNKSQIHNIIVKNPPSKFFAFLPSFLFLFILCGCLSQGIPALFRVLYLVLGTLYIVLFTRGAVVKESVVIIPSFGVQLETHYQGGKPLHEFVPMDKILKPMLLECVTPVTCYWRLSLMLRDEDSLMVVFRDVEPPVEMLGGIWKALCVSTDPEDTSEPFPETFSVPVHRIKDSDITVIS